MQRLAVVAAIVVAACSGATGCLAPTGAPFPDATSTVRPHMGTTEGCPPSFWASVDNHDLWEEHRPDDLVGVYFWDPDEYAQLAFVDALQLTPVEADVRPTLVQEAIAAILNAAHESLEYPYSRYEVGIEGRPPIVPTVRELLRTGVADEIASFARELAEANALGCPLT